MSALAALVLGAVIIGVASLSAHDAQVGPFATYSNDPITGGTITLEKPPPPPPPVNPPPPPAVSPPPPEYMTAAAGGSTGVGVAGGAADQPLAWIVLGLAAAIVTGIVAARGRKSHARRGPATD